MALPKPRRTPLQAAHPQVGVVPLLHLTLRAAAQEIPAVAVVKMTTPGTEGIIRGHRLRRAAEVPRTEVTEEEATVRHRRRPAMTRTSQNVDAEPGRLVRRPAMRRTKLVRKKRTASRSAKCPRQCNFRRGRTRSGTKFVPHPAKGKSRFRGSLK